MELDIQPLVPARWDDFEALFGARGCSVARGCWCMYYRQSGKSELPSGVTQAQQWKSDMKALVEAGPPPGLLGYRDGAPVGWVSLGPREVYRKLRRSPVMRPVDDTPVWSLICFVVPSACRGQGVARAMLVAAIAHARAAGAETLEAYPVDKPERSADDSLWFGTPGMFLEQGFTEVARRKPHRPVLRLNLGH